MTYKVLRCDRSFLTMHRVIKEIKTQYLNSVTFSALVDATQIETIRQQAAAAGKRKPSYTVFIAKGLAIALKEHPYANRRLFRLPLLGLWMQTFDNCDIAVAAEREALGMEHIAFMDILRDADQKTLDEISEWLYKLAHADESNNEQWAQFRSLLFNWPSWLAALLVRLPYRISSWWKKYRGGAAVISSPAKYGVDSVVTSWTHPLGISFGLVEKRPIVQNDQVIVRQTFQFVLNFDRRVMAGAPAARFFKRIVDLLENAEEEIAAQQH